MTQLTMTSSAPACHRRARWAHCLQRVRPLCLLLCLAAVCLQAGATTKGLNQIVTPDIQPEGELSTSLQLQNSVIGNPEQLQLELGLTKRFEVAVFQSASPKETLVGAEYSLVQSKSFLLSTGYLNVERGLKPQPFLESGFYQGKTFEIVGIQQQNSLHQGVFGFGYQSSPTMLITFDYITGDLNFATAGFTYTITPNLTFNPAIYVANRAPHRLYPYGVLTWNSKLW